MPPPKKAVLVYEESETQPGMMEPTKFYGFRQNYKSKDLKTDTPNYALLIYDVSPAETHQNNIVTNLCCRKPISECDLFQLKATSSLRR